MELSTFNVHKVNIKEVMFLKMAREKARIQNIDKLVQLLRSKVKHTPSEMAVFTGE